MTNTKHFVILQLICVYLVLSDCKLEEFYRWKQMSFEGLPLGEKKYFQTTLFTVILDLKYFYWVFWPGFINDHKYNNSQIHLVEVSTEHRFFTHFSWGVPEGRW